MARLSFSKAPNGAEFGGVEVRSGEDVRLLRRIADGERRAFEELYRRHHGALARFLSSLLRSPELMTAARSMGDYLRYKSTLEPRLSEFAILIVAREWTQDLEWQVHQPIALKAGLEGVTAELTAAYVAAEQAAAAVHASYRHELVPVRRQTALVVWKPQPRR